MAGITSVKSALFVLLLIITTETPWNQLHPLQMAMRQTAVSYIQNFLRSAYTIPQLKSARTGRDLELHSFKVYCGEHTEDLMQT